MLGWADGCGFGGDRCRRGGLAGRRYHQAIQKEIITHPINRRQFVGRLGAGGKGADFVACDCRSGLSLLGLRRAIANASEGMRTEPSFPTYRRHPIAGIEHPPRDYPCFRFGHVLGLTLFESGEFETRRPRWFHGLFLPLLYHLFDFGIERCARGPFESHDSPRNANWDHAPDLVGHFLLQRHGTYAYTKSIRKCSRTYNFKMQKKADSCCMGTRTTFISGHQGTQPSEAQ